MESFGYYITVLLLTVALCIALFLALRALVLWYWKVDRVIANQEAQISLLAEVRDLLSKDGKYER
ncbi:MAG TPA: hypothetical protein VD884_14340 [Ohtaekwangia sp.]|nr:hypothetical protein [Ohtaekwangia sp.]